jgi:hypothetical protein
MTPGIVPCPPAREAMHPMRVSQAANLTLGIITTVLVWLCPLLLVVSIAGPWHLDQVYRDQGSATIRCAPTTPG